jgi:hypothetical protein
LSFFPAGLFKTDVQAWLSQDFEGWEGSLDILSKDSE